MQAGTWIRSARRSRGLAIAWALQALFWSGIGVLLIVVSVAGWSDAGVLGYLIGVALVAVGAGLLRYARGCLRSGLKIDRGHVVIVNPLRERRVPLADVRGFRAALHHAVGNPAAGVVLDLGDGSSVPVWALRHDGFVWNTGRNLDRSAVTADRLNALVQSVR